MRDSSTARFAEAPADFAINPGSLASPGADNFRGTAGADTYRAGAGNDTIFGLDGNDHLFGGDGRDKIFGGNGDDVMAGGAGRDVFVFDSHNDGNDKIKDFASADHIRFVIDQSDASGPRQYSDLQFSEGHNGTFVTYGSDDGGGSILLAGVTMDQIDQSQFIFV